VDGKKAMTAHDPWTDKLSDYIDDELTPGERAALEAHLVTCRECSGTLAELREVVTRASALLARPPEADLWPGIAPRLERSGIVMPFQPRPATRRFSFTVPQLVAAGLALMVMSGGGVWVLQHGGRATDTPSVAASETGSPGADANLAPAALADPRYDAAIADLEQALRAGHADLDPGTIKIIEANLDAIDKAIDQSRRALAADPANVYLNNHLADSRQRKLALLRRATAMVNKG
jgi:tetratricopeptide (TPR) repeat protein